jgi:hypothetical protein
MSGVPTHEHTGPLPLEVQARLDLAVALGLLRRYFGDDIAVEEDETP